MGNADVYILTERIICERNDEWSNFNQTHVFSLIQTKSIKEKFENKMNKDEKKSFIEKKEEKNVSLQKKKKKRKKNTGAE